MAVSDVVGGAGDVEAVVLAVDEEAGCRRDMLTVDRLQQSTSGCHAIRRPHRGVPVRCKSHSQLPSFEWK